MEQKYPSLSERIQSSFIDTILIVVLIYIFSNVLDRYENVHDWVRIVLFVGVFYIYEPLFMSFGFTLGNYLKGIRVRKNSQPTKRLSFFQSIVRYPVKIFLGWLSFLTIHGNTKKRAIHDLVAGSVMIKL